MVASVVLWAGALALTIWILVPAIAFALGAGGGVQTDVYPDVGSSGLPGDDALMESRMQQLAALGFRAAGRTREHGRFLFPTHWHWEQYGTTRWFVSPDGHTHVTLSRVIPDEPVRIAAVTTFDGGGMVRTSSPGTEAKQFAHPTYWRVGLRNVDPATLVARHQEQVEAFAREHAARARTATVAEVAAADTAATRATLRKSAAGSYTLLCVLLPVPISLVGLGSRGRGVGSLVIAGEICMMAGLYALLRWVVHGPLLRYNARRSHNEDLAPQPDYVAPDGRIAATGKNERWLRVLAIPAALLSAVWPIAFASKIPQHYAGGGGAVILQVVLIVLISLLVVQFVGRALGKVVLQKKGALRPSQFWTSLIMMAFLFATWLDWSRGTLNRVLYMDAALSVVVGFVGWRLERSRGK